MTKGKKTPSTAPSSITNYPAMTTSGTPVKSQIDEILQYYSQPTDRLFFEVLRSHDQLYAGQIVELPNNDRTAGLITGGYLQLIPPTILGVDSSQ